MTDKLSQIKKLIAEHLNCDFTNKVALNLSSAKELKKNFIKYLS